MAQVSGTTYNKVKEAPSELDAVRKALKQLRRSHAWHFWAVVILAIIPLFVPLGKPDIFLIVGYMGMAVLVIVEGIWWGIQAFRIASPASRRD